MKAVVFHGIGDIRLDDVPEPTLSQPSDAIVRITTSAICGTDLYMIRGTMTGMKPGTILGHEAVGVVEQVGSEVRSFKPGDRVVIPSTIACGYCAYCRAGYFAQCDNANPHGSLAGTSFFGGPETTGPVHGLQAEKARIPFAAVNLVPLPDAITDDQAILLSDILPTAWFGAELASVRPGRTVAIFGCGPVGQLAIACARHLRAGRIFAIDEIPSRLELARAQNAEVVDFSKEDPIEVLRSLTGGIGPDRIIDAVGVDANCAHAGPASKLAQNETERFRRERKEVAPKSNPKGDNWHPGDAPSMALHWAVRAIAKAGTLAIIGVYPESARSFPIGEAMMKNLTLRTGNCNHRKYIPELLELVRTGALDPTRILTQKERFSSVIDAYQAFDRRREGWIKVELQLAA